MNYYKYSEELFLEELDRPAYIIRTNSRKIVVNYTLGNIFVRIPQNYNFSKYKNDITKIAKNLIEKSKFKTEPQDADLPFSNTHCYLFGEKLEISHQARTKHMQSTFYCPSMSSFEKYYDKKIKEYLDNHLLDLYKKIFPEDNLTSNLEYRIKTTSSYFGKCEFVLNKSSRKYEFKRIDFDRKTFCFSKKCINYIIIHELSHIKYQNHSKAFYNLVSQFEPDYKEIELHMNKGDYTYGKNN